MSETDVLPPLAFDALAEGVFSSSSSAEDIRAGLLTAYNSNTWSEPEKVLASLEAYGTDAGYLYRDQSLIPTIGENAPVTFADVLEANTVEEPNPDGSVGKKINIDGDLDLFNKWEEENLKLIRETKIPEIIINRKGYEDSVKEYASTKRQETYKASRDQLGTAGKFAMNVADQFANIGLSAARPLAPIINAGVNVFTDDFDLNRFTNEIIDPEYAKSWTAKIQGGIAQGAASTAVALSGAGTVIGAGGAIALYQGPGALGEVANRYTETKRQTGDVGEAGTAASIEAVSQGLQIVGERVGFGKAGEVLAGPLKRPLARAVGQTAFAEGSTEAAGQAISNAAENLQKGRPTTENLGRNVVEAGVIGGISGGVVGGIAQADANRTAPPGPTSVPGKDGSTVRADELKEVGVPVTPVTKQVIGPIAQRVTENPDAEVEQDLAINPDGSVEVVSTVGEGKQTPLFDMEDGSIASQTEDGRVVRVREDGTTEEAFDDNLYVDEATATEIVQLTSNGEAQLTFDENEEPILVSTDGNATVIKKITSSDTPSNGQYWVGVSKPVSPNKQEVTTHIHPVPSKIRTVNLDRSIGAAGVGTQTQQLSTFGKRLHKTLVESPELLTPTLQTLAQEGLYYNNLTTDDVDTELRQYGNFFGLADWFMSTPDNTTSGVESRAIVLLYNKFADLEAEAADNGDTDTLDKLIAIANPIFEHAAKKEAVGGQAVVFLKGKRDLARARNVANAYQAATLEALQDEALTEEMPIDEIRDPSIIDSQIQSERQAIEQSVTSEDLPDAQEQELYEDEIAALEQEGQEAADTINTTVDEDVTNLEQSIVENETKLERKKAKDIEKIEQQIAKDSETLLEITADAQEIKDLTDEQIEALDTQRAEQLANAEKQANSELKQLVSQARAQAAQSKAAQAKTLEQRHLETKAKADELHAKVRENITKLKLKRSSADEAGQAQIDKRIAAEEARIVKARTREASLKASLDELNSIPEIDAETETILQELESGISVSQVPTGKKRKITIATKRGGLDLAKLFKNSNGSALTALSGLSETVNTLASTLSKTGKLKESANAQIQTIEKKINENKALVRQARQSPGGTRAEQKALNDARKRLEGLKSRGAATAESTLSANKRKKLDLYKTRVNELKNKRSSRPKSEERKARENKVAQLERKKARALAANKRAKQKAVKAAKVEAENEQAINAIQSVINDIVDAGTKRRLQRELELRKAASKGSTIPMKRLAEGMFTNNLIGNMVNIGPAQMNLALMVPVNAVAFAVIDTYNFIKKFAVGRDYRSTLLPYMGELLSKANAKKGASLSRATAAGERVGIPFKDSELAPSTGLISTGQDTGDLINDLQQLRETDWKKFTEALSFEKILANDTLTQKMGKRGRNAYLALSKLSGKIAGPIVRLIPMFEALNSVSLTSAFQAAAAATYHNKTIDDAAAKKELYDTDGKIKPITAQRLQEFIYDSKANRLKAETAAKNHADKLRTVGVEMTAGQQRILEEEIFQSLPSRMVAVDAIKQVGLINLNTPAQGVTGIVVQNVNNLIKSLQDKGTLGYSTRFLVPFANSIGNMAGQAINLSPLGLLVGFQTGKTFNRTPFERDLAVATSVVGTSVAGVLLSALLAELEKPEEERFFDIIGANFSSSPGKRQAFRNQGGLTNSIRIGNSYIPYPETALALVFGALGGYADRVRDGKEADAGMTSALTFAAFDAAKSLSRVSMVKGLTDIYDTIQNGTKNAESAAFAIQRSILNIAKPLIIPGLGALRSVAKYTDNPVDGWKDIKSAIVEGLPFVQGTVGNPALNIFGEPVKSLGDDFGSGLHRIFSTRSQDLDIRWLVDRGYSIPTINDIKLDKGEKGAAGDTIEELEHPAKRAILLDAGPDIRTIVRNFRESYGYSAKSDIVQKNLRKQVNRVLSRSTVKYASGQLKSDE